MFPGLAFLSAPSNFILKICSPSFNKCVPNSTFTGITSRNIRTNIGGKWHSIERTITQINRHSRMKVPFSTWLCNKWVSKFFGPVPGISVIIFGAGSNARGKFFSVNKNFLIAFATPGINGIKNGKCIAYINSFAFHIHIIRF